MPANTPDPLDVLVGARIRIIRTHRGMSQSDLAGKIGVAFRQVQKYEQGINRIGAGRLSRIAAVLGVSIGELFESAEGSYSSSKSPSRLVADQDALRFLAAFQRISDPRVRRAIAQLIEAVPDLRPAMRSSMARPADARRLGKPGVSSDLHDRWLRGQSLLFKYDAGSWQRAVTIFRDAIRENPTFAPCYSGLVQTYNAEHFVHPGLFRNVGTAKATLELAKRAVQLDPVDSRGHLCCGWSYVMALREAEAATHMELACELNDNDPWTLLSSAQYSAFCGSIEQAQLRADQSLALSPVPSHLEWAYHAAIRFLCGDYAGALAACDRAHGATRLLPAWRAAALFHLGQSEMAREEARRFLEGIRSFWVGTSNPTDEAVVCWALQAHPINVSARWEVLRDGLRGAGLPVEGIAQLS